MKLKHVRSKPVERCSRCCGPVFARALAIAKESQQQAWRKDLPQAAPDAMLARAPPPRPQKPVPLPPQTPPPPPAAAAASAPPPAAAAGAYGEGGEGIRHWRAGAGGAPWHCESHPTPCGTNLARVHPLGPNLLAPDAPFPTLPPQHHVPHPSRPTLPHHPFPTLSNPIPGFPS